MNRSTPLMVFGPGLVVTLLVVIVELAGGFTGWERLSVDQRMRISERLPMTDEIVHVDIDDGALDEIGRWPWDRSVLAGAIDELGRAGAGTIALDLILTEPSEPESEDRALAAALEQTRSVLPVDLQEGLAFDPVWQNETGVTELVRLLVVLGKDLLIDAEAAAEKAGLTGPRRERFSSRSLLFKRAAGWQVLLERGDAIPDGAAVESILVPDREAGSGSYPERKTVLSLGRQWRCWRKARLLLLPGEYPGSFLDRGCLPDLVEHAQGVGFVRVDRDTHPDGVVREVTAALPAPGGVALQFGIAAAAVHARAQVSGIDRTADGLRVGSVELPLRDGKFWIPWPASETEPAWEGYLRQGPEDTRATGHLSIREVVRLSESRRTHATNEDRLREITAHVLDGAEIAVAEGEELLDRNLSAAADEVEFVLADAPSDLDDELPDESSDFLDHVHNCRLWSATKKAWDEGERKIHLVEENLAGQVRGKLVFLGWTATGALADFVATPLDARTPGVVVHAAIANALLTGRSLRFAPPWFTPVMIVFLGALCTLFTTRVSTVRSALLAGAALAVYLAACRWLFARDLVFPVVAPAVAGSGSWVLCTAIQAALSQRDRRRIRRQFEARVSPQLVEHLIDDPSNLTVTGVEREVTVMFTDLAGFTSVSEALGGSATVSALNRYLGALSQTLTESDAYVNKFLGDGVMAFWSAFHEDAAQAVKACRAAVMCQKAVEELNRDPANAAVPDLSLRIGISTGKVIVGDCGAPPLLHDYTVIGDAVNLAARLESANKQFDTKVMIDGTTKNDLGESLEGFRLRPLGRIVVVGQSVPVSIFEVVSESASQEWLELTERAVESFAAGGFDETLAALNGLEEKFGASKFCEAYRHAVEDSREAKKFDGVLRLRSK